MTGNQSASTVRQLERDFGNITVNDPFDGKVEPAIKWMVDGRGEELLHFRNADPARVPTFTAFPIPDVYFTDGATDSPACVGHADGDHRADAPARRSTASTPGITATTRRRSTTPGSGSSGRVSRTSASTDRVPGDGPELG